MLCTVFNLNQFVFKIVNHNKDIMDLMHIYRVGSLVEICMGLWLSIQYKACLWLWYPSKPSTLRKLRKIRISPERTQKYFAISDPGILWMFRVNWRIFMDLCWLKTIVIVFWAYTCKRHLVNRSRDNRIWHWYWNLDLLEVLLIMKNIIWSVKSAIQMLRLTSRLFV